MHPVLKKILDPPLTSRPLAERSEPFLAAKRPTASDEVAKDFFESLEAAVSFRLKSEIDILH